MVLHSELIEYLGTCRLYVEIFEVLSLSLSKSTRSFLLTIMTFEKESKSLPTPVSPDLWDLRDCNKQALCKGLQIPETSWVVKVVEHQEVEEAR
jgi:hypothetical protein